MNDGSPPSRPADRVVCTGRLSVDVTPIDVPATVTRGGWSIVLTGKSISATREGDLNTGDATNSLRTELDLVENQISFAMDAPVSAIILSCAREWRDLGQPITESKTATSGEKLGSVGDRGRVFRQVSQYLASDALIAVDATESLLRPSGSEYELRLRRLEVLYSQLLRDPLALVPTAEAIVNYAEAKLRGRIIASGTLAKDIGFLANQADIGIYSRHPELHSTDDLPDDARTWSRTLAREVVLTARKLASDESVTVLDRSTCAPPNWIAKRKLRPGTAQE